MVGAPVFFWHLLWFRCAGPSDEVAENVAERAYIQGFRDKKHLMNS